MEFDSLIFDIDGTLWDSTALCVKAFNQVMADMGLEKRFSREQIEAIMGLPHDEAYQKMFPQLHGKELEVIDEKCFSAEIQMLQRESGDLFPGVEPGLKRLRERFPLFLVSNCRQDYLSAFLNSTGFGSLFKDSECYGNTGKSKGENLKLIARRNSLLHGAYIGDTVGDRLAANQAGMVYFHANWGFGEPLGECWRFDDFEELTGYFLEKA